MSRRVVHSGPLVFLTTVVSCAGGAEVRGGVPDRVGPLVLVQLDFEPPLLAGGRLRVRHEAGPESEVATACTGVALALPPGPTFLRLVAGELVYERTLVVDPQQREVVWQLPTR